MANTGFTFNRTYKIIAIVLAGLLVTGVAAVNWAGGKAAEFVKTRAAQQSVLQGKLAIGDVGASFSGQVWAKDIVWTDPAGKLVAKIPRVNISVRLSDILSANLGANSIETIILERPELHLVYYGENGLNVVNLSKIKQAPPSGQPLAPTAKSPSEFRGSIEIEKGLLTITSGKNILKYDSLDSKISYKDFPKVTGTMQAKQNKADFAGKFELLYDQAGNQIKLDVEGRSIALKDFFQMVPVKSNLTVSEGNITTLKVKAQAVEGKPLEVQAEGVFEGIKAETSGISFVGVKGNLKATQNEIQLNDVSGTLNGQPLKADGKINIVKEPFGLNLNLSSNSFKVDALSPGMGIADPLAFTAKITGSPDAPLAKGNFNMPSLKTDQLEITNASGDFDYAGGVVYLRNAKAGVYGGMVAADGTVKLADKSFVFDIEGDGINSTVMTETAIHGPLSFDAHATGVGDPSAAAASGTFSIANGDFAGIPFRHMTGEFSKLGKNMSFKNIEVHTAAGIAKTNATIDANGKVKFDMIDMNNLSHRTVVENAVNEVKKNQKKLLDGIKKIF